MTNDSNELLGDLQRDLHLLRYEGECETEYRARVVYSAAGLNALAALWDSYDEDPTPENDSRSTADASQDGVSVVRFKRRIAETLEAFGDLFFKIGEKYVFDEATLDESKFLFNVKLVSRYIFELYKSNGYFYSSPYRVYPAARKDWKAGNITFWRGGRPFEQTYIAGLGVYAHEHPRHSAANLFQIDKTPLKARFVRETRDINDSEAKPSDLEYLRTQPIFSKGYWIDRPPADDEFYSLARTRAWGNRLYYWRRRKNGRERFAQIPDWKTQNGEWRNLANAILAYRGTLPNIEYKSRGALVEIYLGYLLPPTEQNLLELYSWPLNLTSIFVGQERKLVGQERKLVGQEHKQGSKYNQGSFDRITTSEVFNALKSIFEQLGYSFEERKNGK